MNSPETKFFNLNGALHFLLLFICVAALGTATFAQKTRAFGGTRGPLTVEPTISQPVISPEAAPTPTTGPVLFANSNLNCSDLVGVTGFSNITANTNQFKYGTSDSNYNFPDTSFFFKTYSTSGGPVETIPANDPRFNTKTITFSLSQGAGVHTLNDFSSQLSISAVIFKLGNDSYAFDYATGTFTGGTVSISGVQQGFSHIIFCFENSLIPTAADISVSGRVLTADGRAVSGARVAITNVATGRVYSAMTNPFGYYTIENLDSEAFYVATIAKKGTKFVEDSKSFSLTDNLADLDFVANQ
jgi:hypothetical protein